MKHAALMHAIDSDLKRGTIQLFTIDMLMPVHLVIDDRIAA